MDQLKIGKFIAQKRKGKKITQEQLAEHLGITNKAVSKWECGRCLPDASLMKPLSEILDITVSELLNGECLNEEQQVYSEKTIIDLTKIIEGLKKQKKVSLGGFIAHLFTLTYPDDVRGLIFLESSTIKDVLTDLKRKKQTDPSKFSEVDHVLSTIKQIQVCTAIRF